MAATILCLVPRSGFTLRLAGGLRWELRNRAAYGEGCVLNSWPRSQAEDALEHCYRLNGFATSEAAADAEAIGSRPISPEPVPLRSIRRQPRASGPRPHRPSPVRPRL